MKQLFRISLLFLTLTLKAQPQPVANLTVFSEDGDKFFLILNGPDVVKTFRRLAKKNDNRRASYKFSPD